MRSEARSPLLTVPELAQRLRVSRRSAYRLARKMVTPRSEEASWVDIDDKYQQCHLGDHHKTGHF
jgi:hypothetical protein